MRVVCVCVWCVHACGVCVRVVCVCVWCVYACGVCMRVCGCALDACMRVVSKVPLKLNETSVYEILPRKQRMRITN